ncbi:MAG: HD domain-containing protein [Patescibacteria group bacterium]
MTENELLKSLKLKSKEIMSEDKLYHDFAHAMGVFNNVQELLKYEGANRLVLLTAALFHDIARGKDKHGAVAALEVEEILGNINEFPKELIGHVSRIIRAHDSFQFKFDERLFSDADKMDAFNELGVIRSFMMYAQEGKTLQEACNKYIKIIERFYSNLYTPTAKQLAKKDYEKTHQFALKLIESYDI